MRKLFLFLSFVALTTLMSSCLNSTEPQYSPEIYASNFYVNPVFVGDSITGAKDTLSLFYDSQDDSYELDTVYVGDTVVFASTYYTLNSNLVAVKIDWDSLRMNLWYSLTEDIEKVLTCFNICFAGQYLLNIFCQRIPQVHAQAVPIYFNCHQVAV